MSDRPDLLRFSLIVPIYNEEENVGPLLDELREVLVPLGPFEALLVDDCSKDRSLQRMRAWQQQSGAGWLRILRLARNSGQSAAVLAGAEVARAEIITTMDGDLQNDPRDLARMLELVESEEFQGVTGIRVQRRDGFLRRVSSRIGNRVRNLITGDRVRDAACGIKAFRREVFLGVPRFNGMHRFMATLARHAGAKVTEIGVNHRPRHAGTAKYGIGNRALRGLCDCFAVRWYRHRLLRFEIEKEW